MAFDATKHLIRVQGNREYLPVAWRLVWFREAHPDWGIETKMEILDTEAGLAVFTATVSNESGKIMARATRMETARGFADYLEKAETGAIGRALALCGFGTQFAPELEEGEHIADAPQASRPRPSKPAQPEAGNVKAPGPETAPAVQRSYCGTCGRLLTPTETAGCEKRGWAPICTECYRTRAQRGVKTPGARPQEETGGGTALTCAAAGCGVPLQQEEVDAAAEHRAPQLCTTHLERWLQGDKAIAPPPKAA